MVGEKIDHVDGVTVENIAVSGAAAGMTLIATDAGGNTGTSNAFDEAVWLALWRLGLPLDDLDGVAAIALSPSQRSAIEGLIDERIASRKPAAYLTGEAWLQGLPFDVDERVIVPRSLIAEVLAEGAIDAWLGQAPDRVLDLCTGNGSLAVLAALAWPEAQVDASDLSADALAVARRNVDRHDLGTRIRLRHGDGLAAADGRYALILCNPPYVNLDSMSKLPAEYRAEPALALDGNFAGGSDGMDFIRPLLAQAARHLQPDGALVLEIGHERAHFETAFPELRPLWLASSAGDAAVLLLPAGQLR